MNNTPKEIINFVKENDVKFIRLTFTDISGNLKNIAIMPSELTRAFEYGIPFETDYFSENYSDLLLFPDISTMSVLPWRPRSGRVIRFFCNIRHIDGSDYEGDVRQNLNKYILHMFENGYSVQISTKCEFYLFNTDENGNITRIPHDNAGYLDIAPIDRCENTRREICLSLEEMGFNPQTSRHSYGPGQNEIDFKRSNPVTAADNMVYYKTVVKNVAAQNGLFASFMPKPLDNFPGNGLHIGISVKKDDEHIFSLMSEHISEKGRSFIAGILNRIGEITCFLNPTVNSYKRLQKGCGNFNSNKPKLLRIPVTYGNHPCIEVRSADAACNPYIAFKLILAAGMEGIERGENIDNNIFERNAVLRENRLPDSLTAAVELAKKSEFVRRNLPSGVYNEVIGNFERMLERYGYSDESALIEDEICFNAI